MSGNSITSLDCIHECPTCDNPTDILLIDKTTMKITINEGDKKNPKLKGVEIPALRIKFGHKNYEPFNREHLCEAQEESGGYTVMIPLSDYKNILGDEINTVSQEWY